MRGGIIVTKVAIIGYGVVGSGLTETSIEEFLWAVKNGDYYEQSKKLIIF